MLLLTWNILALRYDIEPTDSCQSAYDKFIVRTGKNRSELAQQRFCTNFERLLGDLPDCPECDVTSAFDIYDTNAPKFPVQQTLIVNKKPSLLSRILKRVGYTHADCYTRTICAIDSPLKTLSEIPQSVFLAEHGLETVAKDQSDCGACWAFTTTAMLETAILNDAWWYADNLPDWHYTSTTLDLSELYVMANVAGFNDRCEGGNVVTAFSYMEAFNTSVELEQNAPYSNWYTYQSSGTVTNTLTTQNRISPFKTWLVSGYGNIPMATVSVVNSGKPTTTDVATMRSYLARGIAISVQISTSTNSRLGSYTGSSYISGECGEVDHAVTVVGYGKKDGADVWVVKNSWGQDWGYQGHFYVPVGQNAFCIEELATVIVPEHYDGYTIPVQAMTRSSSKQLDSDTAATVENDGTYTGYKEPFPTYAVVAIIAVVAIVIVVAGVFFCKLCEKKRLNRQNVGYGYPMATGQMR